MNQMSQNKFFQNGEGDAWFKRNHDHIQDVSQVIDSPDVHYMLEAIRPFASRINHVLEIGCSNGVKLEAICSHFDAVGVGIEPSQIAVEAGNNREKTAKCELIVGTGEKLPFDSASFDLVYFAFCLYLFERNTLMQSLSEADRVLKPGGFLVITDFDPGFHHKKHYSHLQGLFSYKQDYASFYRQSGLYYSVGKHSFSHSAAFFDESPDERVSTNILYKETDPYPIRK
jgi:ubiquinone/menaquinone biosynthesis C-methylase UbiE